MSTRLVRAAAALGLLALLAGCALNGGTEIRTADDPQRITPTDIAASQATNAYDVVQRIRPAWLRQRVDNRYGGRDLQTLVIYNGARYGFLGSLRDIPAEMIGGMEFKQGSEAQEWLTSNDKEIGAVIEVFSIAVARNRAEREEQAGGGRLTGASVTVYPLGYATQHQSGKARNSMEVLGWTSTERTTASTRSLMVAGEIAFGGGASLGILAARRDGEDSESFERGYGRVHFAQSSTMLAAVLGYDLGPVRIGAGPALQVAEVEMASGECRCIAPANTTAYVRGGVVEAVADLRLLRVLTGELRVQRYLMRDEGAQTYGHVPDYPISRTGWFVGLGAGVRLGR